MIHRMIRNKVNAWFAWAAVAVLTVAADVWAQLPDAPGELPEKKPYIAWIIAFILIGGVLAGALKSGKRSHLD